MKQRRELPFAVTQLQFLGEGTFDRNGAPGEALVEALHSGRVVCRKKVTIVSSGGPNHSLKNAGKSFDR